MRATAACSSAIRQFASRDSAALAQLPFQPADHRPLDTEEQVRDAEHAHAHRRVSEHAGHASIAAHLRDDNSGDKDEDHVGNSTGRSPGPVSGVPTTGVHVHVQPSWSCGW